VSNKSEVWALLLRNEGQWVTRAAIELVGGFEGMRRLREIRSESYAAGYQIKSRATQVRGSDEYMLIKVVDHVSPLPFVCVKCGNGPVGDLQPSTDISDRWRWGKCMICDKARTLFKRQGQ
jgi:hypothetical protein